jgi:di/tripeptidase
MKNWVEIFKELTSKTIPPGEESLLSDFFKKRGFKSDSFGNLLIKNEKSKILITAHIDTFCKEVKEVKHIIDNNLIKTDGTSILGSDNKSGICYLLSMLESGKNYNYLLTVKEEIGRLGSIDFLSRNQDWLKDIDVCLTFDRKGTSDIVTFQSGERCCSDEISESLIGYLKNHQINLSKSFGAKSDTYTFRNIIPECVNISSGTFNEHTTSEYLDLNYFNNAIKFCQEFDLNNLKPFRIIDKSEQTPFEDRLNINRIMGDLSVRCNRLIFDGNFYKFILTIDNTRFNLKFHKNLEYFKQGLITSVVPKGTKVDKINRKEKSKLKELTLKKEEPLNEVKLFFFLFLKNYK